MSYMISRRGFMKGVGIGALALASAGLLGGCTEFVGEFGLGSYYTWDGEESGTYTLTLKNAWFVTSDYNSDIATKYNVKTDEGQRYVLIRFEAENSTGASIDLYRDGYSDSQICNGFYREDGDTDNPILTDRDGYPDANQMVKAEPLLRAYNNGQYLDGTAGVVCYVGGEPNFWNTYGSIPTSTTTIDMFAQVSENLQTFRIVYRYNKEEVNFVLSSSDFSTNGGIYPVS